MSYFDGWPPYVSVAQRKAKAEKKLAALQKKGQVCQPVRIEGRAIAKSFWGKAWCNNLASYSDYANRLPRGSSYVRNGAVIDLRIEAGKVQALVSGSELYKVQINIQPLAAKAWQALLAQCTGQIDSLIELLQGRFSKAVMSVVTTPDTGLFPQPRQIAFDCSCPDGAQMCKHVAATLYGVGARLDHDPALLFTLRQVDPQDLLSPAAVTVPASAASDSLAGADLSALFGIDLAGDAGAAALAVAAPVAAANAAPRKATSKAPGKTQGKVPGKTPGTSQSKRKSSVLPAPALTLAPLAAALAPRKTAASRAKRPPTFSASELVARGLPRHVIQKWLNSGVLLRTDTRGVYQGTAQTERSIAADLAARAPHVPAKASRKVTQVVTKQAPAKKRKKQ